MARCVRCGKSNEFQAEDYRCYECFGEHSPHVRWTDPVVRRRLEDSTSPITWPKWWCMSRLSEGTGFCTVHRCNFPARGCCVDCVAEKRV